MPGTRTTRPLLFTFMLALSALPAGAGEGEPLRYGRALEAFNRKLNAAGRDLGKAVRPALKGRPADLERVRESFEAALTALGQVKKAAASLQVPDSRPARQLAHAYARFLRDQESTCRAFAEVV